jgi:anti-sigma B factor antagonist
VAGNAIPRGIKPKMGRSSKFSVRTEEDHSSATVVVVTGDVDLGTAPDFEQELARSVEQHLGAGLVIDLSGVTFIDSTGLNALVRAFERQRLLGSSLALVTDDARVSMMLEVTRLDRVLRHYPTREEALAAVAEG